MNKYEDLSSARILSEVEMAKLKGGTNPCKTSCIDGCLDACSSGCKGGKKNGDVIIIPGTVKK